MALSSPSAEARLRTERIAILALFVGAVTIAFAPILVRLSEVGPSATGFHRFLLAIPLYWAMAATLPRATVAEGSERPTSVRDFVLISMAGVYLAADVAVWHYSIQMTTVANSTLLANVAPVFVVLAGWILFGTRVTGTYMIGLAAAMTGVFILSRASLSLSEEHFIGDLLGVLTAVFYAAYQMSVERLRKRFSTVTIMKYAIPASALIMLPVALASGDDLLPVTLAGWGFLIALAAGPQVFGQGLIAWALAHLPVAFASVSLLVQPVTAALVAWALFGEQIGAQQAVGGVIVLAGIMLARRGSIRR
ncbi:DMT family transporter [bacterium]|jgi:drug/metabolite transporter (DMT)-like permease|nr:DMT family transporter [Rhodospirillaceae bacterium]MDC3347030.1 DMT family transporter [bacterium]